MSTLDLARRMRGQPTPAEHRLWRAIRIRQIGGFRFRRQVPIGRYIVDFFCPEARLVVEIDGATHVVADGDTVREAWLVSQGFRVMRFWNNDVMGNLPGVLETIAVSRILVIRHGALGDLVLSFAPFAAIRAHHAGSTITLLTTAPFAPLAARAPWFDQILVDARPRWFEPLKLLGLKDLLTNQHRIYDLQTSARTRRYHRLAGGVEWSGIGRRVSHPHANRARDAMHTLERQAEQLAMAGVPPTPPELGWLAATPSPVVPSPYALLVPGASPHRPGKRWPVERFGRLAAHLSARGITPVVIGAAAEAELAAAIRVACPAAIDLTGRTTIPAVASLASRAALAVGNDTGPMHLAAAMGAPSVVLFSADSDPALTAPRTPGGGWPTIVREKNLADLSVARVLAQLPPIG